MSNAYFTTQLKADHLIPQFKKHACRQLKSQALTGHDITHNNIQAGVKNITFTLSIHLLILLGEHHHLL